MRRFALLLLGLLPLACGGAQRNGDADWSAEPTAKDRPFRETEALNAAMPLNPEQERRWAMLGVRHDLMLVKGPREARCGCLAVEVGEPTDKRFFWSGGMPKIGPDTLAIAVDARGVACQGGEAVEEHRRPSISGVDQNGEDVIVEVEDLPSGMPLASGAIIPKPGVKGSIYIKPRYRNVVYGRNSGVTYCKVK